MLERTEFRYGLVPRALKLVGFQVYLHSKEFEKKKPKSIPVDVSKEVGSENDTVGWHSTQTLLPTAAYENMPGYVHVVAHLEKNPGSDFPPIQRKRSSPSVLVYQHLHRGGGGEG